MKVTSVRSLIEDHLRDNTVWIFGESDFIMMTSEDQWIRKYRVDDQQKIDVFPDFKHVVNYIVNRFAYEHVINEYAENLRTEQSIADIFKRV